MKSVYPELAPLVFLTFLYSNFEENIKIKFLPVSVKTHINSRGSQVSMKANKNFCTGFPSLP
jgi:hypothetical protein